MSDRYERGYDRSYDDGKGLSMLIAGFGLGALVGTVIGLLVAPKAGRELRADIAEYGKDAYDKAKDVGHDVYERGVDKARHAYEVGRERASEYGSRVGERLAEVRQHVGESAHRVREAVAKGVDRAADKAHDAIAGENNNEQPA
jgi:gas vesicle protein